MVNDDLGLMISTLRGLKRISQSRLAKKSGVPHPYISNLETGKRDTLKPKYIEALQQALGVDFEKLFPAFHEFQVAVMNDPPPAPEDSA